MGRWTEGQTERYLSVVARYIIFDKNNAAKTQEQNYDYKVSVT
jgi:hypothetical protein